MPCGGHSRGLWHQVAGAQILVLPLDRCVNLSAKGLSSLSLCFSICRMGIVIVPMNARLADIK